MMSGRRSGPRSKTGCWMCRERKIKCDEQRPVCGRCAKAGRICNYTVREAPGPSARSQSQPSLMPKGAVDHGVGSPQSQMRQNIPSSASTFPVFTNPWGDQSATASTSYTKNSESEIRSIHTSHSDPTQYTRYRSSVATASNVSIPQYLDTKVMSHFEENFVTSKQTNTPQWGFMNGLMHICKSDPVLMHFMLAVVGHEASYMEKRPDEQLNAIEHYRRGLVDFNQKIANGDYERHTLLISIWLLTQYELRFAEHGRDIKHHFEGFNEAILAHSYDLLPGLKPPSTSSEKGKEISSPQSPMHSAFKLPRTLYSKVINRLGLWIAYMDACASTFDLDGGVMNTLLHTFDADSIHRIFAGSREALRDIWGEEYPAAEALDDLQNRPAFDAYHHFHILRYKISEFRRNIPTQLHDLDGYEQSRDALITEINILSQQYSSLIKIAGTWPISTQKPDKLTLNLRFIIAFFHACILEFYSLISDPRLPPLPLRPRPPSRVSTPTTTATSYIPYTAPTSIPTGILPDPNAPIPEPTPLSPEGSAALSSILEICTIVHETEEEASLSRCNWPLFVAGIESRDVVHQSWCVEQLEGLGKQGVNNVRAWRVLKAVVDVRRGVGRRVSAGGRQGSGGALWDGVGGGEEVDLDWRGWIRNGVFEEFVV